MQVPGNSAKLNCMKTFRRTLFITAVILLAVSAQYSSAQVPELILNKQFQQDAQSAIHSLYNFRYKKAGKRLSSWKDKYPDDPIWMLLDGFKFWWKILSDLYNTSYDQKFIQKMKQTDYAAAQILYKQPGNVDALLVRMAANGLIARIYSDRNKWIKSLQAAHKAYKLYGLLKKNLPNFPDIKMIDGLKLYYSAYLPQAYPIVKAVSAFLPDGNEEKGLEYLKIASKKAIFVQAEATYFLGDIYYNYEHQYSKAAHYFEVLYHQYPRNNYYSRLLVRSLYKMDKYSEALLVANASLKRWKEHDYPHGKILKSDLWYWKARIIYGDNKDDEALSLFKKSLRLTKTLPRYRYRPNYAAATYYIGIIFSRRGENEEAVHYFKLVKKAKAGKDYQKRAKQKLNGLNQ